MNGLKDVLTNTFLIIFTTIFILLEASSVGTKVEAAFGKSATSMERPQEFLRNLGRYLGIKTIVSLATGFCAWLLTWSIGLDFPLLWGMLTFLLKNIFIILHYTILYYAMFLNNAILFYMSYSFVYFFMQYHF